MADKSLIIGNGNWAVKETSLLGYNIIQSKYVPIEMTVSRNTTATRVNSAGLIELGPKNLFSYSQTFDTAGWSPYPAGASTVIPNVLATSAPNGTFTADKLVANAVAGDHWLLQSATISFSLAQLTVSVFAKKAGLSNIQLYNNAGGGGEGNFDLNTGNYSGVGTSMQDYGNGWYRCIMTYTITPSVPNFNIHIRLADSSGNISFTGNGVDGVYLWGAQLEQSATATEYFPTTDRFNIPRVDYLNSTTGSLLVEPTRSNDALQSDGNLSTYGTISNVTNASSSFNSFVNAIQFPSTAVAYAYKAIVTTAQTYTISVFIKMDDNSIPILSASSTTGNMSLVIAGAIATNNLKVENYGNNVYRLSATETSTGLNVNNGIIRYDTQVLKSFKITGIQVEAGSNATSYIPTTISPITRTADVISKTGISSLIGQTEGTMYAEINITTFDIGAFLTISDGTSTNNIQMYTFNNNKIYCARVSATQSASTLIVSSALIAGTYKVAFAYQSGNSYLYINGAQVGATSLETFTFGSMGKVNIGTGSADSTFFNNRIKSAILFPTRLTPGQLATLTT